ARCASMRPLLFEHIRGESRDRGQAMVDLVETYRRNGFALDARELPDYLPLLLEFLAHRPEAEARDWLHHIGHIAGMLAARAAERELPHAVLLEILVEAGDGKVNLALLRQRGPRAGLRAGPAFPGPSFASRGAAMNHYLHQFAFQFYPYIAVAVLLIGSWARYDKAMYSWRTGSSQLLSDKGMRIGSNCF